MYGELMRIETLVERIAELKETNRRLQTLNAELVEERDKLAKENEVDKDLLLRSEKKGCELYDTGWAAECLKLKKENERLRKENEAYKDVFFRGCGI